MTFRRLSEERPEGRPTTANLLECEPTVGLITTQEPSHSHWLEDTPVSEVPVFLCCLKWKAIFLSPPMLYLFKVVFSAWRILKLQEFAMFSYIWWQSEPSNTDVIPTLTGSWDFVAPYWNVNSRLIWWVYLEGLPEETLQNGQVAFPRPTQTSKMDWI